MTGRTARTESPDVDRKTDRLRGQRFEINDIPRRVLGVNDRLNVELVYDNLKNFRYEVREPIRVTLEKGPEADLLEGLLYPRRLRSRRSCKMLWRFIMPWSHKGLKDQQNSLVGQKQRVQVKDRAVPIAPSGHRKGSCSGGANCTFRHDDPNGGKTEKDEQQRMPGPTIHSAEVSNWTGARQEKKVAYSASFTQDDNADQV